MDPDERVMVTEREALAELLELYRDLPCLWDSSHEYYSNREARQKAHQQLLDCFLKYDKDAKLSDLKKKIDNMRTAYKREKKKVDRSIAEGSQYVHVPSLWYYSYLRFLDEDDPLDIHMIENSDDSDAKSEEPKRKKRAHSKSQAEQLVMKQMDLIETAKTVLNTSTDECSADAFGRSISCQLKELPKLQRCLAEKLIGEVMFHAKLNQLNMDTVVYLNDDTQI